MTVLAVDIGGTKVAAALVTEDGAVIEATRRREPTGRDAPAAELGRRITAVVRDALAAAPDVTVDAVGLASAGPVDEAAGTAAPINMPALHGFPLRDTVREAAGGLPVEFRRDGVAVVLAEHWLGAARGGDALGMVVSTGVGGGFIVGGRVLAGNAGHIGQVELSGMTGGDCLGRSTMLESVASGPNIVAWARQRGFAGERGEELGAAYAAGDAVAIAAVARCAAALGQAIGSALALVPVPVVSLGGGFAHVAVDLVQQVQAVVAAHPLPYVAAARVVPAGLGGDAPLVGAAALVYRRDLLP